MSNFRPDTGGRRWSLVQLPLVSRAAGREGHCRQISVACVGSTHSVLAILGLPPLTGVCFPHLHISSSWLLYVERPCIACGPSFRVVHKSADSVVPAFCAFPGPSSSGSQQLDGRTLPGCAFSPLSVPASVSTCASRVSAPYSQELASSSDPPGRCRPSKIS